MTPSESIGVRALVVSLWPRVKWSEAEWTVFAEKLAVFPIDLAQADAAIREFKATSEKYPTVAGILNTLRHLCIDSRGVSPVKVAESVYPNIPAYRRQLYAAGLGLSDTASNVVLAWWRDTLEIVMLFRGDVPAVYRDDFINDGKTLAGMLDVEVAEHWDVLMGHVAGIERCPKRYALRSKLAKQTRAAVAAASGS